MNLRREFLKENVSIILILVHLLTDEIFYIIKINEALFKETFFISTNFFLVLRTTFLKKT